MENRSRGISDEELFLSHPAREGGDSPTVEPLRIFKPQSPKPQADQASGRFKYPRPPSPASSSSSHHSKPSFPLPPGASSSAAPLPYPDDDDLRPSKPSHAPRPPYPSDSVRRPSNNRIQTSSPAISAGSYNDTSPRLNLSTGVEKKPGLAERRGTAPTALSPTSDDGDKDNLFAKPVAQPKPQPAQQAQPKPHYPQPKISATYQNKPYYPPPGGSSSSPAPGPAPASNAQRHEFPTDSLHMPQESSVSRFASTASTSTTRASRGSPPPPETPVVEPGVRPGDGIEARYAASGIPGAATLTGLQAQQLQNSAASQRLAQYGGQPPPPRPWTPTETPDQQPHGPPTVYQGSDRVKETPQQAANPTQANQGQQPSLQVSILEQDFARMQASTPPPAYTSVNPGGNSSYPNEKQRPTAQQSTPNAQRQQQQQPQQQSQPQQSHPQQQQNQQQQSQQQQQQLPTSSAAGTSAAAAAAAAVATSGPSASASAVHAPVAQNQEKKQQQQQYANPLASPALQHQGHPAFANDPRPENTGQNGQSSMAISHTPSVLHAQNPTSPPPLPEGWISHLDQNSGQYYYIHLATQATQWEFPKGPNPINHEAAPLSPTASTYGNPLASPFLAKQGMGSPGLFPPQTPGYAESIMSVAASAAPTAGFTGPPPSSGVDIFKVAPTNGVYFGPYLRYVNMDVERGVWLGSIMIVTDAPQPPTIHIHLSVDLSPNPRMLNPHPIHTHQRWTFYKYDLDLQMGEQGTERWTYAVTSHLGCTRYEFVVAGRQEACWRFIAHSGNDFAASTSQNERAKLGGVGFMWKDVLQKNVDCGGFHVQLGLGDQIYGDRLWKEVPLLKQWLSLQGRENRKTAQWTARHEEDVTHAYFHYYTSHFDQPFLREAFAQIPHILQLDDHDM